MSGKEKFLIELDDTLDVPQKVIQAARKVELIAMDVDGVLTDGHTYQLDNGEQFLRFSVQDGLAFNLCSLAGIALAVISGRDLEAARIRLEHFPVAELHLGCPQKEPVLIEISRRLEIPPESMAYIGDDLLDLPLMALVGLPVAVPNAAPEVLQRALYCTQASGGRGAVRELITLVLKAKGLYEKTVNRLLGEH